MRCLEATPSLFLVGLTAACAQNAGTTGGPVFVERDDSVIGTDGMEADPVTSDGDSADTTLPDGAPAGPPEDPYTCVYVNPFNNAQQCKQYRLPAADQAARTAAEMDCATNPVGANIDQGEPGFFATGECETAGAVGYCTMPDGSQDYVFEADCSIQAPSARWGCEDQAGGSWTCLDPGALGDDSSKYTCVYVNPFNNAEQCKEYPLSAGDGAALADAEQDCAANPIGGTIDLGDPGRFTQGTCDRAGAIGYCLFDGGATDFVYEGDCLPEPPSAQWGCEVQAMGDWICLEPGSEPVGDKYTCTYVNPFNAAAQCKEYTVSPEDGSALASAEADCVANPIGGPIMQGDPGTFAAGECDTTGSIGYCIGQDDSRDYVYAGDCDPDPPSAKWGCEDQDMGIWICTDDSPDPVEPGEPVEQYHCDYEVTSSPPQPITFPVCREYGFLELATADLDCGNQGGALSTGPCSRSGVVGYCPGTQSNDLFYADASCTGFTGNELQGVCGASHVCGQAPPEPTAAGGGAEQACAPDDRSVVSCRYESSFTADNCADFPQGFSEADARAFCSAQQGADAGTVTVSTGNSCLVELGGTASADRCQATDDMGRTWYAYGTGATVCDAFIPGAVGSTTGPFCEPY